jgi:hypothetical protein
VHARTIHTHTHTLSLSPHAPKVLESKLRALEAALAAFMARRKSRGYSRAGAGGGRGAPGLFMGERARGRAASVGEARLVIAKRLWSWDAGRDMACAEGLGLTVLFRLDVSDR